MPDDPQNAYAAPQALAPLPPPAGAGVVLVVDVDKKIPRCCLKCAATKNVVRRQQDFAISPAARGLGYGGGAVGAAIAAAARNAPSLLVPLLVGAVFVIGIVAWIFHATATRVHVSLPLCRPCDERWRRGVGIRRVVVTAIAVIGAVAAFGLATHAKPLLVAALVAFVATLVAAVIAKLPPRLVGVQRIDGSFATLTNVSRAAVSFIQRELPLNPTAAAEKPSPRQR